MQEFLVKYNPPSKYCFENYGTIWMQMHDGPNGTLFIQCSKNAEEPNWMKVSDFLEKVFCNELKNEEFVTKCLNTLNGD